MDLLLITVLVVVGGFGLHGYIRGMVRVVFSLAAVFVTIILSSFAAPYVAEFLTNQTPLYEMIQENSKGCEWLAEQAAGAVVERIAWILTFILISILLGFLIHVLDIIAKLPGIDTINHAGGLAVGLLEGLVVVWILFLVITLCQGSEWGGQMMDEIQNNPLLELLYENNLLEQIFER
ncbi:MAG: CvpA family protein [Lachnospiraceae bacterium]|nr:CvpA family protein [Lachnospiraceae bacterium]